MSRQSNHSCLIAEPAAPEPAEHFLDATDLLVGQSGGMKKIEVSLDSPRGLDASRGPEDRVA